MKFSFDIRYSLFVILRFKKSPKCKVLQKCEIDSQNEITGIYLKGGILPHVRVKPVWHEICFTQLNYSFRGCKDEAV